MLFCNKIHEVVNWGKIRKSYYVTQNISTFWYLHRLIDTAKCIHTRSHIGRLFCDHMPPRRNSVTQGRSPELWKTKTLVFTHLSVCVPRLTPPACSLDVYSLQTYTVILERAAVSLDASLCSWMYVRYTERLTLTVHGVRDRRHRQFKVLKRYWRSSPGRRQANGYNTGIVYFQLSLNDL